jgi:hypothetical protein
MKAFVLCQLFILPGLLSAQTVDPAALQAEITKLKSELATKSAEVIKLKAWISSLDEQMAERLKVCDRATNLAAEWKAEAEKLDAASQANYKAAEEWKAAALENNRIVQENKQASESDRRLAEWRKGNSSSAPQPAYVSAPATADTDAEYQQALEMAKTQHPDLFVPGSTGFRWMTEYTASVRLWAAEGQPDSIAMLAQPDRGLGQIIAWSRGRMAEAAAYVPPPNPVYQPRPKPVSTTTVITGANGVYTTHWAGGGATIIETVPGVWEIRNKDGTMQRVLKP